MYLQALTLSSLSTGRDGILLVGCACPTIYPSCGYHPIAQNLMLKKTSGSIFAKTFWRDVSSILTSKLSKPAALPGKHSSPKMAASLRSLPDPGSIVEVHRAV